MWWLVFRIASVAGGFHLATQGKVVGYDRYILARVGLRIGCHSRIPSCKIPWQTETLVSHSSLHGVSVALAFLSFTSATIFLVITSLHERCYIGCSSWCVSRTPPYKTMGNCHSWVCRGSPAPALKGWRGEAHSTGTKGQGEMAVNHLPQKRSAERCSIEVRCLHYLPICCYWVCVPPSPSGHILSCKGKT